MGEYVISLHSSHRVYFIAYSIPRGHVVYKAYGMLRRLHRQPPTGRFAVNPSAYTAGMRKLTISIPGTTWGYLILAYLIVNPQEDYKTWIKKVILHRIR